jgi:putative transposase
MKTIRSAKIKISGSSKAPSILDKYISALNWLSTLVFSSHELNSNHLAHAYYPTLRTKFQLPSQLACSICKHISATYQSAKSNKRWELAIFKNATLPLIWKRDFNKSRRGITLWGEPIQLYHPNIPPNCWKDSKLKKIKNTFYLILCYEKEIPDPKTTGCIVGVDSGLKRIFVASNSFNTKPFFFSGKEFDHLRRRLRHRRGRVQAVGTRSARRLKGRLAHRERAITEHAMHVASKDLTNYCVKVGARMVIFEDLSNVRKSSLKKGKNLRERVCRWPYGNLQFKASYKLAEKGIETTLINPAYTSQACPRCGYVSKENRKGLKFRCMACSHTRDSDWVGSENIRSWYIIREQCSRMIGSVNPLESSGSGEIEMVSHSVTCSMPQG